MLQARACYPARRKFYLLTDAAMVSSFASGAFACSAGKQLCTTTTTYSLLDSKMRVHVNSGPWGSDNTYLTAVDIEAANSIAFLKRRIWAQTRISPCEMYLYDDDTVLEDHHILAEHDIQAEHIVYCDTVRHEPICPGCSFCARNFCSSCGLYPIVRNSADLSLAVSRPFCPTCRQGQMSLPHSPLEGLEEQHTRPSPQSWPVVSEPAESNGGGSPQAASEEALGASIGSDSQPMSSLSVHQLMAHVSRQETAPAEPTVRQRFADPEVNAEQSLFEPREPAPQPQHSTSSAQTSRIEQLSACSVWDAHMGSVIPLTTAAVPFYYSAQLAELQVTAGNMQADFAALMDKFGRVATELHSAAQESRCCICLYATHDAQLLPCMHNRFCKACLERHLQREKNCPVCRSAVQGMLTTFG